MHNTPNPLLVGIDLGGTKIQVAATDFSGRVLARLREPTPRSLPAGLDLLRHALTTVSQGAPIAGVGVAIGGPINALTGVVSPLHQPEWRDVPLGRYLETWSDGAPWRIEVDTDAAALAEYHLGGHGVERLLYVTVSTGVGGGFVVAGDVFRGAGGAHPEFGHQAVPGGEGVACPCGARGCLEALVSGTALQSRHKRDPETLDDAAWAETGRLLGLGLRNACTLLAPQVVALGGGVVFGAGERLLAPARAELFAGLRLVPAPRVTASALGYDTALQGALVLASLAAGLPPTATNLSKK